MTTTKNVLLVGMLMATSCFTASAGAQTMRPEAEKKLAHDIYKEFIEIQSGYTTGATTPVVQAAVRYLKAAGFSDSDIFVGGASDKKANLVVRLRGTGAKKPILRRCGSRI
jgi:acetylornithine deacetylase/succinyl-diaminopimelate desuccinylase-like protein